MWLHSSPPLVGRGIWVVIAIMSLPLVVALAGLAARFLLDARQRERQIQWQRAIEEQRYQRLLRAGEEHREEISRLLRWAESRSADPADLLYL